LIRLLFAAAVALASASPAVATPSQSQGGSSSESAKVICRRAVETGSLVRGRSVCKTRRAWQADGEAARRDVQVMQDQGLVNSQKSQ
jgi:hypothetical protein